MRIFTAISTVLVIGGGLVASAEVRAQEWQALGPAPIDWNQGGGFFERPLGNAGRVAAIAASTTRPNRYYLGAASGGVWESLDGGGSWTPLTDHLPSLAIGAVALDPVDDQIIYAGSGEAHYAYHSLYGLGLYKSIDGGRSWRILARQTFAGRTFARLVVSPFDRQVIWAAIGRAGGTQEGLEAAHQHPSRNGPAGIFRSSDGGESWDHLTLAHGLPPLPAADVDCDPQDRRRIYVCITESWGDAANGIYRSTDGGASFVPIGPARDGEGVGRITLAIAPSDPRRLYALYVSQRRDLPRHILGPSYRQPSGGSTLALYRSDDGGASWTSFYPGDFQGRQGTYNAAVAVHPSDPDTVFLGGVQMLRSTDGGLSYDNVTPPHVDIHDLTFDAAGRLLAAGDGGIHRSEDGAETWVRRNGGLSNLQFYPGLSVHPTDPWTIIGGTQDNGTNLRSNDTFRRAESGNWIHVLGGDGGYTAIRSEPPYRFFAEIQGTANLYRSSYGGTVFARSSTGIDPDDRNCFLPPVVFDPNDPNRLLYATHRIWESTDQGVHWTAISDDLTGWWWAAIRALAIAPSDSNVVYAATNDGLVLVSNNGGHDWEVSLEGIFGWHRVMRQLAVDPLRPSLAFLAVSQFGPGRLLMTRDRGRSWSDVSAGLPNFPVNTVAVHRTAGRRYLLAGTDAGVYLSTNNGGQWRRYGSGLPRAPVMDLVVDVPHQRVVASTLGRGMWVAPLPGTEE